MKTKFLPSYLKLTTTFLLLLLSHGSFGQTYLYQEVIGDTSSYNDIWSLDKTKDGGYILAGGISGSVNTNGYIIKIAEDGTPQWSRAFVNPLDCWFLSVQQTEDLGYIMTGVMHFDYGQANVYLLKTDSQGNFQWSKRIGYTSGQDEGQMVKQTKDKGFIIIGSTGNCGTQIPAICVIKMDSLGNLQWNKTISNFVDYGTCIEETSDGGFILCGYTYYANFPYMAKLDNFGNIQWAERFFFPFGALASFVQETKDSGFILTGSFLDTISSYDIFLIKANNNGNIQWGKVFSGTGYDYSTAIEQTNDNGYIILGNTTSFGFGNYDIYLIKTDSSGVLEWSKTYGYSSQEVGRSIKQNEDGGFIIAGITGIQFGTGSNGYLVKTDKDGNSGGCNEMTVSINEYNINPTIFSEGVASNGCSSYDIIPSTIVPLLSLNILCFQSIQDNNDTDNFKCGEIFIPNIFSPNGDGQNDTLYVRSNCIKDFTFSIYNRWGEKVFETNDINEGWDGGSTKLTNHTDNNTEVFMYYLTGEYKNGDKFIKKGNITLIR